jgi:hypothetical protein
MFSSPKTKAFARVLGDFFVENGPANPPYPACCPVDCHSSHFPARLHPIKDCTPARLSAFATTNGLFSDSSEKNIKNFLV